MKMASGYRSLRKDSHGVKPNFVLPANYILDGPFIGDKDHGLQKTGKKNRAIMRLLRGEK